MSITVTTDVEVELEDEELVGALEHVSDAALARLGFARVRRNSRVVVIPPGFGNETPTVAKIKQATQRGDLREFIELTRVMLDEHGFFILTDRLLATLEKEISHAT